jgi:uncharacterized membrane protein YjjP (DUF1212 family)
LGFCRKVCAASATVWAGIVDRPHLPFAALAFSAVVSFMPGFFLFNAATRVIAGKGGAQA